MGLSVTLFKRQIQVFFRVRTYPRTGPKDRGACQALEALSAADFPASFSGA
jgi:hypothetical protein